MTEDDIINIAAKYAGKGYTESDITDRLKKAGYPEDVITDIIDTVNYIKSADEMADKDTENTPLSIHEVDKMADDAAEDNPLSIDKVDEMADVRAIDQGIAIDHLLDNVAAVLTEAEHMSPKMRKAFIQDSIDAGLPEEIIEAMQSEFNDKKSDEPFDEDAAANGSMDWLKPSRYGATDDEDVNDELLMTLSDNRMKNIIGTISGFKY